MDPSTRELMPDHIFQLILILAQAIVWIAFYSIRRDIFHVRELLELRLRVIEDRCLLCPDNLLNEKHHKHHRVLPL